MDKAKKWLIVCAVLAAMVWMSGCSSEGDSPRSEKRQGTTREQVEERKAKVRQDIDQGVADIERMLARE